MSPALYALFSGHFYPECRGGGLAVVMGVAMAAVHNGIKLHEIHAFFLRQSTTRRFHVISGGGSGDGGGAQWDVIV